MAELIAFVALDSRPVLGLGTLASLMSGRVAVAATEDLGLGTVTRNVTNLLAIKTFAISSATGTAHGLAGIGTLHLAVSVIVSRVYCLDQGEGNLPRHAAVIARTISTATADASLRTIALLMARQAAAKTGAITAAATSSVAVGRRSAVEAAAAAPGLIGASSPVAVGSTSIGLAAVWGEANSVTAKAVGVGVGVAVGSFSRRLLLVLSLAMLLGAVGRSVTRTMLSRLPLTSCGRSSPGCAWCGRTARTWCCRACAPWDASRGWPPCLRAA